MGLERQAYGIREEMPEPPVHGMTQVTTAELLAMATHQVVIPHLGQIESLNVAACAAVCFFEQLRQNQA